VRGSHKIVVCVTTALVLAAVVSSYAAGWPDRAAWINREDADLEHIIHEPSSKVLLNLGNGAPFVVHADLFDRAIAACRRALKSDYNDLGARTNFGALYLWRDAFHPDESGNLEKAIDQLVIVLEQDSKNEEALRYLGMYQVLTRVRETLSTAGVEIVVAALKKAVASSATLTGLRSYARVLLFENRTQEALSVAKSLIKLSGDDVTSQLVVGAIYLRAGQIEQAKSAVDGALTLSKGSAVAYLGQAEVQERLNRLDEGKKNLLIATNMLPAEVLEELAHDVGLDAPSELGWSIGNAYAAAGNLDAAAGYLSSGELDELRPSPTALEGRTAQHFNTLTHLIVDPKTGGVTFYGTNDPAGPQRSIPYAQFLAAALRLPAESGPPGAIGGVPGFSLEPIQDIYAAYAEAQEKSKNPRAVPSMLQNAEAADDHDSSVFVLNQCIDDLRAWLLGYISSRTTSRDWVPALNKVTNIDELIQLGLELVTRNILDRSQFAQDVSQAFTAITNRRLQQQGGMLFLPHELIEDSFGLNVFSRPTYFGIEADTQLARIIFESDFALKRLAGPRGHDLARTLTYHQTLIQWIVNHTSPATWQNQDRSPLGIMQISPGTIVLAISADKAIISFDTTAVRILVAARNPHEQLPQSQVSYANFLTQHYDDYAREVSPLWEIREAMKVIAAARLLHSSGSTVVLEALNTSWSAPNTVKAEWDFAAIGLGPSRIPTGGIGVTGGVDLQIQTHMQVNALSEARARELAASAILSNTVSGQNGGTGLFGTTNSNPVLELPAPLSPVKVKSTADIAASAANSGADAMIKEISVEAAKALSSYAFDQAAYAKFNSIDVKKFDPASSRIQSAVFPGLSQQNWNKLQNVKNGSVLIEHATALLSQKAALQQKVDEIRNSPNAVQHQQELIDRGNQLLGVTNEIAGLQSKAQKIIEIETITVLPAPSVTKQPQPAAKKKKIDVPP
jgi:tetratricopeptide (TPR) repeat protein